MMERESGRPAHLMKPAGLDVNYGASVGSLDRHQHREQAKGGEGDSPVRNQPFIQPIQLLHILVGNLESAHIGICHETLGPRTLGQRYEAVLDRPPCSHCQRPITTKIFRGLLTSPTPAPRYTRTAHSPPSKQDVRTASPSPAGHTPPAGSRGARRPRGWEAAC